MKLLGARVTSTGLVLVLSLFERHKDPIEDAYNTTLKVLRKELAMVERSHALRQTANQGQYSGARIGFLKKAISAVESSKPQTIT